MFEMLSKLPKKRVSSRNATAEEKKGKEKPNMSRAGSRPRGECYYVKHHEMMEPE